MPLKVNKLSSTKTLTPFEFNDVPFCKPNKRKGELENLVRRVKVDQTKPHQRQTPACD